MRASYVLILIAATSVTAAGQPAADVPASERQILVEFFMATGGERWKIRDGWVTSRPVCYWYGVSCEFVDGDANRPSVSGLRLDANNLQGEIPPSLAMLPHLNSLSVYSNLLSGAVPEVLLTRWDNHDFEFSGEGNRFSNLITSLSLEYVATGALCGNGTDLRFRLDVSDLTTRALFQSVQCAAPPPSRDTYCLVREGKPDSLARLSRALSALGFRNFRPKYDQPFTFTTHAVLLTTAATWGDGVRVAVETYDRGGPRDVWIAQQLFLALATEIVWERESRASRCEFQN